MKNAIVAICAETSSPMSRYSTQAIVTISVIVMPAGSAFENTLLRKLPSTFLPLGSSARKKDGMPTNSALISVSCMGTKG